MNILKRIIHNIVFDVVNEHSEHHFISFQLINNETGEKIDEHCSLAIMPRKGDVIICDDSTNEELHFKFNVVSVEYSSSGIHGQIFGTVSPKPKEDFQGTEKAEMIDLLKDIVVLQEDKMLDHQMGVTARTVEKIEKLLNRLQ